jgi:uncharacterized protein YegJ (DUF2314 family)
MSESQSSPVFMFDNDDPEMQQAYQKARQTFGYFWREVSWERRRIVPALDLATVKAPFSDSKRVKREKDTPEVEHMWISDVDFDGKNVDGVLLNAPNWLKTVKEGDSVQIPLREISDWMYVIQGEVFGAFTVNLLRSRMGQRERQEHDNAWGLNFGDPKKPRLFPEPNQGGGILKNWFGKQQAEVQEHPMSESMAASLKDQLAKDPTLLTSKDDLGWTLLHQEALAGNTATVKVLLEAGADPKAPTDDGMTPLQLANSLHWDKVAALLSQS